MADHWLANGLSRINESIAYGNVDPLDYDAWDGYQANRNRTFKILYDNKIDNNIVISGDSHANWVSDLIWLDSHDYDQSTGCGSVGVEFAGTAVSSPCPYGQNSTIDFLQKASEFLVGANRELQWSELYYRGYYEVTLSQSETTAQFFGLPTIVTRNGYEISLANFTVKAGENKLSRDLNGLVAGGVVENGILKGGKTIQTNMTNDTATGNYFISHFGQEDI